MVKEFHHFGVERGAKHHRLVRRLNGICRLGQHNIFDSGTTRPVITQGRKILLWGVLKFTLVTHLCLIEQFDVGL